MKVVYVPGLEEALQALIKSVGVPQEGGKIPIAFIPAEVAKKSDLTGFLTAIPAATTSSLGGCKLYSNTSPQVADRTYGVMVNDQGGYLRTMPARIGQGVHWAGVVNVYSDYNGNLSYAFSDVYGASAVNAAVKALSDRLDPIEGARDSLAELIAAINAGDSILEDSFAEALYKLNEGEV